MSEEKWNSDMPIDKDTTTDIPAKDAAADIPAENAAAAGSASDVIVDSTAEVVSETAADPVQPTETYTQAEPSYTYETYGTNTSYGDYAHADTGSATGNGSYQYSGSNHEYYQGENYGSSVGSGSGGSSGGRGKGFLAVILAIVFGVCIGAAFWGVHRYLGKSNEAEAAITDNAEDRDSSVTGEKNEEEQEEVQQPETAEAEPEAPVEEAPVEQEAQAEPETEEAAPETTDDAMADAEGIKNEAGLIIADTETPETELTRVVDKVMPSIVSVYNDYTEEVQTFYGETFTRQGESTGSGIIIGKTDEELLIVTNNHVVEGADNLRVLFIDNETCDAELKGTDPSNDLAVIAVSLDNIKDTTQKEISVATLGNSDTLKIGEDVIAIGNALGYGQSVTTGIVSANNREISDGTITGTFIQTDAAINPGNSGGALVNINGNVIGINSSKIGGDTVEGMGFAIPISKAIPIIEELMNRETLSKVEEGERGTIGISGATVTSDVSSAYNMPVGVYVAKILENGGAANSDLHEGDIITAINGQTISSMEELQKMLEYYKAGTEVTLTVQRQDGNGSYAETTVKVTLGTRESIETAEEEESQNGQGGPNGGDNQRDQNGYGGQDDQNGYNEQSGGGSIFNPFGFPFGF